MAGWEEQLERVRRYHRRFAELSAGRPHTADSETYFDDVHAFFQNCHHLKDWLKNDPRFTKRSDAEVEAFITNNHDLALCADVANGRKHLVLKSPRSGSVPGSVTKHITLELTDSMSRTEDPPPRISAKLSIEHDGKQADAFQLATDCLKAWESFLQ